MCGHGNFVNLPKMIPSYLLLNVAQFMTDLHDLVRLTGVCSSWREVLLSTSALWQARVLPSHLPSLALLPSAAIRHLLVDTTSPEKRDAAFCNFNNRSDLAVQDVVVFGGLDRVGFLDKALFSERLKSLDMQQSFTTRKSFKATVMKLGGLETLKVDSTHGQADFFLKHIPNPDKLLSLTISGWVVFSTSLESLVSLDIAGLDVKYVDVHYVFCNSDVNFPMLHTLMVTKLYVSDSLKLTQTIENILRWNRPKGMRPGERLQVVHVACKKPILALDSAIVKFYLSKGCTLKVTGCILI